MSTPEITAHSPRRPFLRFWMVATVAEVLLAGLLLATGGDTAIERGLASSGMQFNTDLVTALHLGIAYPAAALGIVLSVAQVSAPDLAVLVVTRGVRSGPASLAAVRSRFRFWSKDTTTGQGLLVWAQMTATFLTLSLATAGLDRLWLGPDEHRWEVPSPGGLVLGLVVAMFLDAGAVLEENGWRGYALPLLLQRHGP